MDAHSCSEADPPAYNIHQQTAHTINHSYLPDSGKSSAGRPSTASAIWMATPHIQNNTGDLTSTDLCWDFVSITLRGPGHACRPSGNSQTGPVLLGYRHSLNGSYTWCLSRHLIRRLSSHSSIHHTTLGIRCRTRKLDAMNNIRSDQGRRSAIYYLGDTEESYTLNFSRPGAQVIVQYFNLIRCKYDCAFMESSTK